MLRRGHVPRHVAMLGGIDWCAGLARRNGLVCGGGVGRPCCRSGCGHSFSSLRTLGRPSEPVWWMLNATAITGVGCGNGLRCLVCSWVCSATAGTSHHVGAVNGPSILPI